MGPSGHHIRTSSLGKASVKANSSQYFRCFSGAHITRVYVRTLSTRAPVASSASWATLARGTARWHMLSPRFKLKNYHTQKLLVDILWGYIARNGYLVDVAMHTPKVHHRTGVNMY